jgi:hypothetical protein
MLVAWVLKVESCFPAVLDPSHFHSNRTKNQFLKRNIESSTSTSCHSTDTSHLDESDTSLLHRTAHNGIANHQYGKGSTGAGKFSSHIDIEMNGGSLFQSTSSSRKPDEKNMKIGDSNSTNVGNKDSKNPHYTRLPV